ncbi:MAG: hypothetical protein GY805_33705, partial [Chloroflexi bacterium]|nr:hypothetical protein [Chloroflexota bacterium]
YAPQLIQGVLAGDPDPRKPEVVYKALGGQIYSLAEVANQNGRLWLIDKHLLNVAFREEKSLLNVEDWRQAMPVEPIFEDELLLVFATSKENLP